MNFENKKITQLLFLCVANSARSQMAEYLAHTIFPKNFKIFSAGSRPGINVHPLAIEQIKNINPSILSSKPKSIDDISSLIDNESCIFIRLCAEEECPLMNNAKHILNWNLPDPANPKNSDLQKAFENTKVELEQKLYDLLNKLEIGT